MAFEELDVDTCARAVLHCQQVCWTIRLCAMSRKKQAEGAGCAGLPWSSRSSTTASCSQRSPRAPLQLPYKERVMPHRASSCTWIFLCTPWALEDQMSLLSSNFLQRNRSPKLWAHRTLDVWSRVINIKARLLQKKKWQQYYKRRRGRRVESILVLLLY